MLAIAWNLLFFLIALGVLITFHELGHFWVARRCGVKVLRFSIGFGKPLLRWRDKQQTEYVLAAIPLGGYVKMLDERVETVAPEEAHLAFNQKSVWQRIAIVAAGPLANILLAVVAYWLMFITGIQTSHPVITGAQPGSIAEAAGIDRTMQIIEVDGRRTLDWEAVNFALVAHVGDEKVAITGKDPESDWQQEFQLDLNEWQFDPEKATAVQSLGLEPYRPQILLNVSLVQDDSPAAKAGFLVGDKILSVNGQEATEWQAVSKLIQASALQQMQFEIERNGKMLVLTPVPQERRQRGESQGYLGIAPKVEPWPEHYVFDRTYGLIDAVGQALDKTWQVLSLSVSMIGKLITGDVSVKNLSGPISIAQGAGASASFGFVYFLGFVALISINIGILNLLPLPVLDGGHLVYYCIELLTGRPVPEKVQDIGFRIGAMALMLLMGLALFNDFSRL